MIFIPNTPKPTKHNSSYVAGVFVHLGQKWQVMGYVVISREVFSNIKPKKSQNCIIC